MLKACIFDLDGVVTDTAEHHFESWKEIANIVGYTLTRLDNENLKGVSRADSLDKICTWANRELPEAVKAELLVRKNEIYLERISALVPEDVLPGVLPLLNTLKSNGILIAIGSSSKNAKAILSKLGIINQFDAISDGTSVKNTKPAPDVFLHAAKNLHTQPQNCVVFEDAPAGVEAAIAGGMKVIGVGRPEELNKAHMVLADVRNLTVNEIQNLF